jgi:hypothetical protein
MGIFRFVGVGLLAFLFLFVVATVAAFVYLPWWQALPASFAAMWLLFVAAKIALKQYAGRKFGKLLKTVEHAMEDQGMALRGARVEVHSVTRIAPPFQLENSDEWRENDSAEDEDGEDGEDDSFEAPACYQLDMTITPVPKDGPADFWHPGFLRVLGDTAPVLPLGIKGFPAGSTLEQIEMAEEGNQDDETPEQRRGPKRFRAMVRVPTNSREATLYYFLEKIGRISLPASQ